MLIQSAPQQEARLQRKLQGAPRRDDLLDAAAECFVTYGYAPTTIRHITSVIDASRGTFYSYFASKHAIFLSLTRRTCDELLAAQHVEGKDRDDLRQVLEATTAATVQAIVARAALLQIIIHEALLDPEVKNLWESTYAKIRARYSKFIATIVQETGQVSVVEENVLADFLTDAVYEGALRRSDATSAQVNSFISNILAVAKVLTGIS